MKAVDRDLADQHNLDQRKYFESTDQRTLKPTGSLYLRRHTEAMTAFAHIQRGDRVLELGCGLGRYTMLLAEAGVAVEGLDLSPQLLEQLEAHNAGRYDIPLHGFDIIDAPKELYGTFDAVIGFFVLHHVHDLEACLAVATQLVRPGGRVAFLEPNPSNPLYYFQIAFTPEMAWKAERGMLKMTTKDMFPAMRQAGMTDVECRRFGLFPPFVTNRKIGAKVETKLDPLAPWHGFHPFQLFGGARA
jgi:2-polyprenyl-3-methyl-5-hydroxy-6-metoxy-1,4-benzoquinol methylase